MQSLGEQLERQRNASLYRSRILIEDGRYPEIVVDGQRLLAFCNNDYLGMADHPEIIAAVGRNNWSRMIVRRSRIKLRSGWIFPHREAPRRRSSLRPEGVFPGANSAADPTSEPRDVLVSSVRCTSRSVGNRHFGTKCDVMNWR